MCAYVHTHTYVYCIRPSSLTTAAAIFNRFYCTCKLHSILSMYVCMYDQLRSISFCYVSVRVSELESINEVGTDCTHICMYIHICTCGSLRDKHAL